MNKKHLGVFAVLSTLALVTGCGASRDVTVSGDIATEQGIPSDKPVQVDVYETAEGAEAGELTLADSFTLDKAGAFEETVAVEGDTIHVVALIDTNGNGKCDTGEAWGEADAEVSKEDLAEVALRIASHGACPAVPAAE